MEEILQVNNTELSQLDSDISKSCCRSLPYPGFEMVTFTNHLSTVFSLMFSLLRTSKESILWAL